MKQRKNFGFAGIMPLLAITVLVFAAFLLGKSFIQKGSSSIVNTQEKESNVNPFPIFSPNGQTYYNSVIYKGTDDKSEKILEMKVYPSKYLLGPVRPVVEDSTDRIYYASAAEVFEYDLSTKTARKIYSAQNPLTITLIRYEDPNYLYITEESTSEQGQTLILKRFDLNTNLVDTIVSQQATLYGNVEFIGKTQSGYIIGTFGGDGCGGYGEIYKVEGDSTTSIKKTGGGCVPDPSFISYSEKLNSLITVSSKGEYGVDQKDEFIYLTNVDTREDKAVFDLTRLNDAFSGYFKSENKEVLYLVGVKKVYTLDLNSLTITKQSDLAKDLFNSYPIGIFNNNTDSIIFIPQNNSQLSGKILLVDLTTGQIERFYREPMEKDPITGTPISLGIIGFLNNNLLFDSYSSPLSE